MDPHSGRSERIARWLVPIALIAFAVAAIYLSTTFKKMPPILKRGIQPSDFPQLIAGLIIFLTVLMVWRDPIKLTERISGMTLATFGAMAGFALLVQIDLMLALGVFAAGLAALWGERRVGMLSLVGVGVPVAIFFLFDFVFQVRFPRGLLTNLWYG